MARLCLGTVQFGLDYGINNKTGKPSKEQVFEMLNEAIGQGIKYIDTAQAYGNSEELLGEYNIKQYGIKVTSKLRPNLIEDDCDDAENIVEMQIRSSLDKIGIEALDGYLLHTPENFYNPKILSALKNCQDKGLIKHFGVSIYETQHALDVVKSGLVDYIQIPYSVFDQRLDKTDFFEIARINNVTVFARSAFLQGLIFMEEHNIPEHLNLAKEYLREFDIIIKKYGFSRLEAAFWFSFSHPGIDYLVFGVDNIDQLRENILLSRQSRDFEECRRELSLRFVNVSKSIIFPSLWKKKRSEQQ